MQNKPFKAIVALPNAVADVLNPGSTTGGVNDGADSLFIVLRHIRVMNKDVVSRTVTMYVGASGGSAAGTEFAFTNETILPGDHKDWNGYFRLSTTDFLTAVAAAAVALVANFEGEIGVA